jgi:predicted Zn-dependent protease
MKGWQMNKIGLLIIVIIVAVALSGIASASAVPAADKANGKNLVPVDVIHWQKGFAKPGGGDNDKGPTCYAFLKYGKTLLKWDSPPVSYVINPTASGLSHDFVTSAIQSAAETWDNATSVELFSNTYIVDDTAVSGVLSKVSDSRNTITWGNYPQSGVIAVTRYWIDTTTNSIAEFDIMFDTDYAWGDAASNSSLMDVQNIATHELGHGIGLSDVYKMPCSAVTMYGYSDNGDISKRDLAEPDIIGLQALYGQ